MRSSAELAAEFERALKAGDGVAGAHCIHERWMRGEFAAHIEASLDLLWKRAAATIPEWLPMRYVSWLPTVYDVTATIPGRTHPDEIVRVGGHHDAWTYGSDDNLSGAEAVLQLGRGFSKLLKTVQREHGTSILLIEHDMSVVMEISDHVIVLEYGIKISDGSPEHVRNDPKVIAAYLGVEDDEVAAVERGELP